MHASGASLWCVFVCQALLSTVQQERKKVEWGEHAMPGKVRDACPTLQEVSLAGIKYISNDDLGSEV